MVMMADFRAAHAAEKFLCHVRASAVRRIRFFAVDALHLETGVKIESGDRLNVAGLAPVVVHSTQHITCRRIANSSICRSDLAQRHELGAAVEAGLGVDRFDLCTHGLD